MRVSLLFLFILLIICSAVDRYLYRQIQLRVRNPLPWLRLQLWSAVAFQGLLIVGMILPARAGDNAALLLKMWVLFSYATIYLPKILFVTLDLLAAIPTLFHRRRLRPLTLLAALLSLTLFGGMWWGALINRFRIDNREVTISISNLPASFDGYRIVQISDLHLGTYIYNPRFLARLINDIHRLNPDLIVFTGDIVNRQSAEIRPFVSTLATLDAPDGAFAILGNHDYGDYMDWDSPAEKRKNMQLLIDAYAATKTRLLRNETVWIHRGNDSLALIGVENIGDPPFPVYGSLQKAYPSVDDSNTKILLTHNPAHWVDSIADNPRANIALTLSGHTHAMQIELLGLSPAAWRYPTWGGLYADKYGSHQLYVNIGVGTVGLPMRLGATPEVTLITLRRSP